MFWYERNINRIKKYRLTIFLFIVGAILSWFIGKVGDTFLFATTTYQIILGLLGFLVFLATTQMVIIERDVIWRILTLEDRVSQISGRLTPTQYDERKYHFSEEKHRLVENLIQIVLPDIIIKSLAEKPQPEKIALIVDSGTTLEQFFPRLKLLGLGPNVSDSNLRRLEIFTNSLSGSEAFCKTSASIYLRENQLHLFGGTQMEKHRAVVGNVTITAMNAVKEEYIMEKGIIIGLITANWILVGNGYDKLILCSTEKGHLDYKKSLAEMSDVLIIVTPLGKLLKLDSHDELSTILKLREDKKPEYDGFELKSMTKRNKQNTILLTTHRNKNSSILYPHSKSLSYAYSNKKQMIYELFSKPSLALDYNYSFDEQIKIEMPHNYLHEYAFQVLQINRP